MSAAEIGVGGPSSPRSGVTLVARLQARAARLRALAARWLDRDESTDAAWATALAAAPQAVPNLPRPRDRRRAHFALGFVVGAHVALLVLLYWRSTPPPPPESETTVELVREMPEAAKPKPAPEQKHAPKPPQPPVQEGKAAEPQKPAQQQAKQEPQKEKSEPHPARPEQKLEQKPEPKPEQKPEPRQPKAAHQHQSHRAPPPQQQQQQAEAEQRQPSGVEHAQQQPERPIAMPAVALPGASAGGTEAVSYQQLVLSQVAKAKKQGRYMGVPGYAGVRFRVAEDGSLEMVKLVVSSGDANLDIEAEAMIRRAAPFPKPPPGSRRDYGITLVFAAQPQQ